MVEVNWGSFSFLGGLLVNQPATIIAAMLYSSPRPPFDVPQASQTQFFDACYK